jgi:cation:H+ antiporter
MTGANRLLIGVAWGVIAAIFWIRYRRDVRLERDRRTEILFLGMATAYAFVIPIKGSLAWYDGLVFLGIYVWYIVLAGRRPCEECEAEGPAEVIVRLSTAKRRTVTIVMFLAAAGAILANAEPFCEGLIGTGKVFKINEFLLVQWLAPIASEAPEFVVAILFAWRGQGGVALGSLLSAKLNQWTLLVGMIPGVFALSSGGVAEPMPMTHFQLQEILLTASQSLLAVFLLASMRFTVSNAILLFILFAGQLMMPEIVERHPQLVLGLRENMIHPLFSMLYLVTAGSVFLMGPKRIFRLWRGMDIAVPELVVSEPEDAIRA